MKTAEQKCDSAPPDFAEDVSIKLRQVRRQGKRLRRRRS